MKKISTMMMVFAAGMTFLLASCGSTQVKRYDTNAKRKDLSRYWNETDVRQVCETMIDSCIHSKKVANFQKEQGRATYVIIGKIANKPSEHLIQESFLNDLRLQL